MFFRWIFKSAFAILIVSNTWNIVMGVFDATQSVVNQSSGVIIGETSKHPELFDRLIEWENEDNIFHRRMTRRETPSEVKARLLSKSQTGFSSPKRK